MATNDPTAHRVREALDYDPDSGLLVWRHRLSAAGKAVRKIGKIAGCVDSYGNGRLMVRLDGRLCYAHRLAWIHFHGVSPQNVIDHINGDPADNRICNLRDVLQKTNMQNRRRAQTNRSDQELPLGVHVHQNTTKLRARVGHNGKEVHLGLFDTAEEAHNAYLAAKRKLHEGCTI